MWVTTREPTFPEGPDSSTSVDDDGDDDDDDDDQGCRIVLGAWQQKICA